jgi:hypothetical protein
MANMAAAARVEAPSLVEMCGSRDKGKWRNMQTRMVEGKCTRKGVQVPFADWRPGTARRLSASRSQRASSWRRLVRKARSQAAGRAAGRPSAARSSRSAHQAPARQTRGRRRSGSSAGGEARPADPSRPGIGLARSSPEAELGGVTPVQRQLLVEGGMPQVDQATEGVGARGGTAPAPGRRRRSPARWDGTAGAPGLAARAEQVLAQAGHAWPLQHISQKANSNRAAPVKSTPRRPARAGDGAPASSSRPRPRAATKPRNASPLQFWIQAW